MMPITFGSLPFNILTFTCGCLAKTNHWLDGRSRRPGPHSSRDERRQRFDSAG
jgi:hypothetical protein